MKVCFWDVCTMVKAGYFSAVPDSLVKLSCQTSSPCFFECFLNVCLMLPSSPSFAQDLAYGTQTWFSKSLVNILAPLAIPFFHLGSS